MPAETPNDVQSTRLPTESRRALLTPSASPSLGPPDRPPTKRPRHRSTPFSSKSATPSASNDSTSSTDVNSARRASTLRVLNTWAQLAERYNKRLDEDDIIDLHRFVIIKDRGAVEGAPREYHIGHLTQLDSDQDYIDDEQDQEDSEQDEDDNELNGSEATTDDDAISKKELLRGVPPLSATTDAEDLREFLEAEKKRRELAGDQEEDEDMSAEQRSALKKELEERQRAKEAAMANRARDEGSAEPAALEHDVDATPTRPSTRVPPPDDESEDELALWTHDESTAVYPVAQHESGEGIREVDREVIELTDSDSDKEFASILIHPPRFAKASPAPVLQPREIQQPLQSPPNSERGRSKSRAPVKGVETPRSEDRQPSPRVARKSSRKPEVVLVPRRKQHASKETTVISEEGTPASEVISRLSPIRKGKSKEITPPPEDDHRTPKPVGPRRGRKRKRVSSSSINGGPLAQSPKVHSPARGEPKSVLRRRGKSTSQSPTTLPRSPSPGPTLDEESSPAIQFEPVVAGPSRSLKSPGSRTQQHSLSVPACRSLEPESVQLTSHDHNASRPLLSDPPVPIGHPYSQRHPSHPPSIFTSPNQVTPGLSFPAHPPPIDPVQAQQAHYLLAQAMNQLSYFLSATMPPYATYASNPGQPWQPPPPPLPPPAYSTPVHHHPHLHGTRYFHPSSSSTSRSGLPPSSPVRSSMSPPVEERARTRGRSRSRGRRVSFQLDSKEVIGVIQPELQLGGQKNRKQSLEVNRERGKVRATEELDGPLRLEDRGSPPREVGRGRTPGPPMRKNHDGPRSRSLGRR